MKKCAMAFTLVMLLPGGLQQAAAQGEPKPRFNLAQSIVFSQQYSRRARSDTFQIGSLSLQFPERGTNFSFSNFLSKWEFSVNDPRYEYSLNFYVAGQLLNNRFSLRNSLLHNLNWDSSFKVSPRLTLRFADSLRVFPNFNGPVGLRAFNAGLGGRLEALGSEPRAGSGLPLSPSELEAQIQNHDELFFGGSRLNNDFTLSGQYLSGPSSQLTFDYRFSLQDFKLSDFAENNSHSLALSYRRDYNSRLRFDLSYNLDLFMFKNFADTVNHTGSVGAVFRLTPTLLVEGKLGAASSSASGPLAEPLDDSRRTGYMTRFGLIKNFRTSSIASGYYRRIGVTPNLGDTSFNKGIYVTYSRLWFERLESAISASRLERSSLFNGGNTEANLLGLNLRYRLADRLRFRFSTSYYQGDTTFAGSNRVFGRFAEIGVNYQASRNFSLFASYFYASQSRQGILASDLRGSNIFFGLYFTIPSIIRI